MYNIFKTYTRAIIDRPYGSHHAGCFATEGCRVGLSMMGRDIETTYFSTVPGFVAGIDAFDEWHFDLARLCT